MRRELPAALVSGWHRPKSLVRQKMHLPSTRPDHLCLDAGTGRPAPEPPVYRQEVQKGPNARAAVDLISRWHGREADVPRVVPLTATYSVHARKL